MLRERDSLRVVALSDNLGHSIVQVGQLFPLSETAAGRAVEQRRMWTGKAAAVEKFPDTRALCPPQGTCLIIPLQFQQRVIGAFLLSQDKLAEFHDGDQDNLTHVAAQMAIAIEHARLYELERQRSGHLTAINEASRDIAAALNLNQTLKRVMSKATETLPMDAGALFQFDPGAQAYRVAVSHNLSSDHVAEITFAFEEGVPGWVVKHRQTLIVPDAVADERVHPCVVEEGIRSVMATPLVAREQVVGVLNLYCKTQTNAFDDEAAQLAEVFAAQAAIAIENARLVEELRRAAAELEARVERRTRQLRETQKQIIRAEKMAVVGRLATSVAHEVNNPLQAIGLQLQLIADDGLAESAGRRMAIVQEELARIVGIVQRLLDFQRPALGKRSPQELSVLLTDVLALADKQLQQHDIIVSQTDEENLKPVLVAGNQMKQVFLNLVLNAIEATPPGGS